MVDEALVSLALRSLAAQARASAPRCPRCWRGLVNVVANTYGWCQPCEREHDERLAVGDVPAPVEALLGPPPARAGFERRRLPADFADDRKGPELLGAAAGMLRRRGARLVECGWQTCGRCHRGRAPLGADKALCGHCAEAHAGRRRQSRQSYARRVKTREFAAA